MGFTFWNEWQKNIDLFHDILIFLDVPVYGEKSCNVWLKNLKFSTEERKTNILDDMGVCRSSEKK